MSTGACSGASHGNTAKSSRPALSPPPDEPDTLAHGRSSLQGSDPTSRSPPQRQQRRGGKLRRVRSRRKVRGCWSAYGLTVGWRRCIAVAPGEIQRPPGDVGRPSLAGDFARFCQRLFERYSLYSAALHFGKSAPCLILPSPIDGRVDFAVFGAQYPIDQIGDRVLGPIAGLFDYLFF